MTSPTTPSARSPRWGMRTLGFLILAALSIVVSNTLRGRDETDYILLPFLTMVAGLVGAGYCSIRGLRAMGEQRRR